MHRSRVFIGLALLLLGACKSEPKPENKPAAAPAKAAAPTTNAALAAPAPSAKPLMDIPQRFAFEAAHRPAGALRAEQVYDAIAAAGIAVTERKQHLAGPFGADYCQGAEAKQAKLFFSVCEFAKESDAEQGIALAEKFGTDHRAVLRNGQSLLIVRYPEGDPAKAEGIFKDLKPRS